MTGPVAAPRQRQHTRITLESAIEEATARRFLRLYQETFGPMATKAVARQVLHDDEFLAEMVDPRVEKYLAWDDRGEVVAMCTLTRHLETVPWISPEYFAHHYPEATARDAVYYLGFILVDEAHRRAHLFSELIDTVTRRIVAEDAVCAWDICDYNNRVLGLSDALRGLFNRVAETEVVAVDTQTYYCGRPVPQQQKSDLPGMRQSVA